MMELSVSRSSASFMVDTTMGVIHLSDNEHHCIKSISISISNMLDIDMLTHIYLH